MREQIRRGVNAGITFALILVFLGLIGFTVTGSEIIAGLFGLENIELTQGNPPPSSMITGFVVLLGLFGLWAGSRGAHSDEAPGWRSALTGSLAAGVSAGLIFGLFVVIVSSIAATGADMRVYLAQLSTEAVALLTLGQPPIVGALLDLVVLAVAGLLGGLLNRLLGSGGWRTQISRRWAGVGEWYRNIPAMRSMRESKLSDYILYAVLLAVVLILPAVIGRYWNYTLGTVGIYVLLGLGLNIVVGMAGLLDLGYVAFFAIGAYTVALLTAPEPHHLMWSFWAALPVGIVLAGLAGILLGIPVLRLRGDYLAIVTLGFGEIIRILSKSDMLTGFSGGPRGVRNIAGPTLFGAPFNNEQQFMYLIIAGCLIVIFVTSRLQSSRVGRAWIAMREDETVAQAMGINTWQYKLMAFAIGAAFAGLGGVLFASRNQFTGPEDHNLLVSINVLSLVIVGGMGSIPGVIVGALALKGLPEILREVDVYRMLVFGGLLVAMMVLRPEGIWPSKRRRLELEGHEEGLPAEEAAEHPLAAPGGMPT
jgi:ABC-type branched-subunit amino acid transport system permease subunit